MSLSEDVYKELKRLYDGGMTQEEVAAHCHIKHSQAQRILSGTRSAGGLRLETLDKMFPHAVIDLYGDGASNGRGALELERKNLELDKENLELKKKMFEQEQEIVKLKRDLEFLKREKPEPTLSESTL